jgi:predicted dehydrogenase
MRIGLLGAARIAPQALIGPCREVGIEVAAVAARDADRARAFADEHGIARAHPSYRDLVEDDTLDAVYIALPISLHAAWSIAALEAGRHVLCEKAMAENADQAARMVEVARANHRLLVEAFHWRYHPVAERMLELTRAVGPIHYAESRFDAPIAPGDIRYDLSLGGGAMMDLGCYPVHWLRTLLGEPQVRFAEAAVGPDRVDLSMTTVLRFNSVDAVVRCSMRPGVAAGRRVHATMTLHGEGGWFCVTNPQAPQWGSSIVGECGQAALAEVPRGGMTYPHQLRAFADMVAGRRLPLTGGADAIANLRVLDAVYTAAGLGLRGR